MYTTYFINNYLHNGMQIFVDYSVLILLILIETFFWLFDLDLSRIWPLVDEELYMCPSTLVGVN